MAMGKPALRVMEESTLQPSVNQKLFADAVHSIKNSLGGIAGFAALLDRDLDSEDPKKRLTQRIQDGVMRVNDMVVSLMLLAAQPHSSAFTSCSTLIEVGPLAT